MTRSPSWTRPGPFAVLVGLAGRRISLRCLRIAAPIGSSGVVLIAPSAPFGTPRRKWNFDQFLASARLSRRYDKWNAAVLEASLSRISRKSSCALFTEPPFDQADRGCRVLVDRNECRCLDRHGARLLPWRAAQARSSMPTSCPVMVIHGTEDEIDPIECADRGSQFGGNSSSRRLGARSRGARPAKVNLLIREFVDGLARFATPPPRIHAASAGRQRALYLSSPIGLGHGRRDLAITRELTAASPRPRGRLARPAPGDGAARGRGRAHPPGEPAAGQ